MKGLAWTKDDDYIAMCTDLTVSEKSYLLNRTESSVRNRITKLKKYKDDFSEFNRICRNYRVSKNPSDISRSHTRWEPTEDKILMQSGLSDEDIAKILGRSISAIIMRRFKLNRLESTYELYSYT